MTWTALSTGFEHDDTLVARVVVDGENTVVLIGSISPLIGSTTSIMASTDGGATWSAGTSVVDAYTGPLMNANVILPQAVFGNGYFAAAVSVSPDGFTSVTDSYVIRAAQATPGTWTATALPAFSSEVFVAGGIGVRGFAFLDGQFVLSVVDGANSPNLISIMTSADAVTWSAPVVFPFIGNQIADFASDGTTWVAVGDFGGTGVSSFTSTDGGATWIPHSGDATQLFRVAYHDGFFVAAKLVSFGEAMLYKSPDGATWTPVAVDPTFISGHIVQVTDVSYAGGFWWASGADFAVSPVFQGSAILAKSADGDTWALDPTPYNAYNENTTVAIGVRETTAALVGAGFVNPPPPPGNPNVIVIRDELTVAPSLLTVGATQVRVIRGS